MNTSPVENYESPELFDLGSAEELTLACCCGCACDCCGCKYCCGASDTAFDS